MNNLNIGFIGAGNMARALLGGLCASGFSAEQLFATDPHQDKLDALQQDFGIQTCTTHEDLISRCDVIVLAVKPQVAREALEPITIDNPNTLIVSVVAGIRTSALQKWLGSESAIVRTMPNTPALVQAGATGLFANPHVTEPQREAAEHIMRAVGICLWVDNESQLDAVTALSGSGPAYFFFMMEAMEKAGIKLGLNKDVAHLLTVQTAFGAAKLALEAEDSPEQLRTKVTSPGGTTERAIQHMQNQRGLTMISEAVEAAFTRSQDLAKELEKN